MKYLVKRYWEVCDQVEVEANDIGDAINRAHELPLSENAEYVCDSINSDEEFDVQEIPNIKEIS